MALGPGHCSAPPARTQENRRVPSIAGRACAEGVGRSVGANGAGCDGGDPRGCALPIDATLIAAPQSVTKHKRGTRPLYRTRATDTRCWAERDCALRARDGDRGAEALRADASFAPGIGGRVAFFACFSLGPALVLLTLAVAMIARRRPRRSDRDRASSTRRGIGLRTPRSSLQCVLAVIVIVARSLVLPLSAAPSDDHAASIDAPSIKFAVAARTDWPRNGAPTDPRVHDTKGTIGPGAVAPALARNGLLHRGHATIAARVTAAIPVAVAHGHHPLGGGDMATPILRREAAVRSIAARLWGGRLHELRSLEGAHPVRTATAPRLRPALVAHPPGPRRASCDAHRGQARVVPTALAVANAGGRCGGGQRRCAGVRLLRGPRGQALGVRWGHTAIRDARENTEKQRDQSPPWLPRVDGLRLRSSRCVVGRGQARARMDGHREAIVILWVVLVDASACARGGRGRVALRLGAALRGRCARSAITPDRVASEGR